MAFLKEKPEAFKNFKIFKAMVENEFCEGHGIKRQFLSAKTPQQNGVVERKNRTV